MSNKQIAPERWKKFFEEFSHGNQGRRIKLETVNPESGDQIQFEKSPLLSLVYDSVNTGQVTVSTKEEEITHTHTIHAPNTVWEALDQDGKVLALEILDEDRNQTILQFQEE